MSFYYKEFMLVDLWYIQGLNQCSNQIRKKLITPKSFIYLQSQKQQQQQQKLSEEKSRLVLSGSRSYIITLCLTELLITSPQLCWEEIGQEAD